MAEWSEGVAWQTDLETGDARIDGQHKELFKLTSDLLSATSKSDPSKAFEALEFLANYTLEHFADEEALSLRYDFPGYADHKALHDAFRDTALDMLARHKADRDNTELNREVNTVVVKWLLNHIVKEDHKLAAHIRAVESPAL